MEVQERGYRKQLRSRFQVMNEPGRKLCFAIWSVSPNVMTEYIYIYIYDKHGTNEVLCNTESKN